MKTLHNTLGFMQSDDHSGGTIYVKQVNRSKGATTLAKALDMNDICIQPSFLDIINEHRSWKATPGIVSLDESEDLL